MIEIMSGIFLLAVMTGIIFVRFSRPVARIAFSRSMVIAPLNGKPTLMVRVGNENQHSIVDTEFRIMFMRDEPLIEGGDFRYFYILKLHFDRMTVFPAALDATACDRREQSAVWCDARIARSQSCRCFVVSVSELIRSSLLPSRHNRITAGATFTSANASSKSIPSQAAASSRWITADFTKPKLRSKFRPRSRHCQFLRRQRFALPFQPTTNERSNTIWLVMSV